MRKFFKHSFVYFIPSMLIFLPYDGQAYIDPGTGSYIMQVLIATAVGGAFAVKMFWLRIKLFFYTLFSSKPNSDINNSEPEENNDGR